MVFTRPPPGEMEVQGRGRGTEISIIALRDRAIVLRVFAIALREIRAMAIALREMAIALREM